MSGESAESPGPDTTADSAEEAWGYEPPVLTRLGDLSELTLQGKTVGAADGATFLGLNIGS